MEKIYPHAIGYYYEFIVSPSATLAAFYQRSCHLLECIRVYQGYCFGKQFLHLLQWTSLCTTWESLRKG